MVNQTKFEGFYETDIDFSQFEPIENRGYNRDILANALEDFRFSHSAMLFGKNTVSAFLQLIAGMDYKVYTDHEDYYIVENIYDDGCDFFIEPCEETVSYDYICA